MKIESYYPYKTSKDVTLAYCGYEKCESDFKMHPSTRAEYLIHYITHGSGVYICEGTEYKIDQGDLFIIFPSQLVSYYTNPEKPLHFSWFAFSADNADSIIKKLGFSSSHLIQKLYPQFAIDGIIHTIVQQLNSTRFCNKFTIQSMLYSIFSNITESYNLSINYAKKNQTILFEHIERAKSYIKCNYIYHIAVTDVARHIGLERSYFSKVFRQHTGVTAQNYILNVRIQHSKLLLERTDYMVKEICTYVGMKDQYYFSRSFKKSVGLSPTQYRHNFRQSLGS